MVHRLPRPHDCLFDEDSAQRAVDFFNRYCRHGDGQYWGQPFNLRPWQEHDIREVFGRVDEEGNRTVRLWYEEIPKKNGKTELAAGVALKLLFADDEPGAEVYGAAADRDQASIVFDVAAEMVRQDPSLLKAAGGTKGIVDSRKRIICPSFNSFYRAITARVAGKHGFKVHGCIFDEVHAQADSRLWEVLTFGAGANRRQPLTFAITTAGIIEESPVAEMLHQQADQILRGVIPCPPSFYPVMYSAPANADWHDEAVWAECNPAYGDFLSRQAVAEEHERARLQSTEENSFRRLRLNQWVQRETRWIPLEQWDACNRPINIAELKHLPCYAGIDVGASRDLTALVLVWLDGNAMFHWLPFVWVPRGTLERRTEVEASKYRDWASRGYLRLTDGDRTDPRVIRQKLAELRGEVTIRQIASDKTFALQLQQELSEDGFEVVDFPQSFSYYNEPCRALEDAVSERRVLHGGHPVLRWMIDNISVSSDRIGRIMPARPKRLQTTKRIDAIVAGLMAMSRAILEPGQGGVSVYEQGVSI